MNASWMTHVSLVHGIVPVVLTLIGPVLAAYLAHRSRLGVRKIAEIVIGSWLAVVILAVFLRRSGALDYGYPRSFVVWVALAMATVIIVGWSWRRWTWRHRGAGLGAVALMALFAGGQINQHYGYYFTLADLAGEKPQAVHTVAEVLGSAPTPTAPARSGSNAGKPSPTTTGAAPDPGAPPTSSVDPTGAGNETPTAGSKGSDLVQVTIPPTVSGFHHRTEFVWLPPAWHHTPRPALPVIVMLAGSPGAPDNWFGIGITDLGAATAKTHHGWAPILVFADQNGSFTGDTECVDGPRGNAETYLTVDLPRYLQTTFGASTNPADWTIAGLSEGGTCAPMISVRHPDRYGHFIDLSGDVAPSVGSQATTIAKLYGGDATQWVTHDTAKLLADNRAPISGWFSAGSQDHKGQSDVKHLYTAAQQGAAIVKLDIGHGGHSYYYWRAAFPPAYAWVLSQLSGGVLPT
jgi:S-formylglutathione hydrolase FrmB